MWKFFEKKDTSAPVCPPVKRFFSIALGETTLAAVLWEADTTVKVLSKSEVKPYFGDNDLLIKLDQALQELGSEGETVHQTLFHLDSSLIRGSDIAAEKRELFDKITTNLQLESIGFVANTEGVINAKLSLNPELDKQLVVEFTSDHIIYSLFSQKQIVGMFAAFSHRRFGHPIQRCSCPAHWQNWRGL